MGVPTTLASVNHSKDCILLSKFCSRVLCFEVDRLHYWDVPRFLNSNFGMVWPGPCSISYQFGSWPHTLETCFHVRTLYGNRACRARGMRVKLRFRICTRNRLQRSNVCNLFRDRARWSHRMPLAPDRSRGLIATNVDTFAFLDLPAWPSRAIGCVDCTGR